MFRSIVVACVVMACGFGAWAGAPFDDAVAVWNLADGRDSAGKDSRMETRGAVELGVALEGGEREESLRHGGDGRVARFAGGFLHAGQGADGELNLATDALTVCLRVRDPAGKYGCPLFSKYGGHEKLVYNFFAADLGAGTVFGFELGTEGGMTQVIAPLALVGADRWHDLVARYDGAKLQLFVDGVWLDEGFPLGELRRGNTEPCLLGAQARGDTVETAFRGLVDHVALWNRALSDAEIEALSGGRDEVAAARLRIVGAPGSLQYFRPHNQFNVGDTFPLWDDGVFRFYYLLDRGHHSAKGGYGAHQWAQATSTDLINWEHQPPAVPITAKREGSICTGSVFFHDGVYYAFYATRIVGQGEHLSLAVGNDGVHFTKTEPNPFLSPGPRYTRDFRDPHVFRHPRTGKFHLLVSSVLVEGKRGCLAQFTSDDLKSWKEEEPFYIENSPGALECSEHFEWNGRWYLIFNGCYRMASDPLGPWTRPKFDRFDGPFFAVPKTAGFRGNRRIVTAWIPDRGWGGRAVFREVVQQPEGALGTRFVPEMALPAGEPVALALAAGANVSGDAKNVIVRATEGAASASLGPVPRDCRLTLRAAPGKGVTAYGVRLRASGQGAIGHTVRLEPGRREVRAGASAIGEVDALDRPVSIEVVLRGDILDVCVDGRRALLDVVHELPAGALVLFSEGGETAFEGIEVRPLADSRP